MRLGNNRILVSAASILTIWSGINHFSAMAWRSHGINNRDMVSHLKRNGVFHSQEVEEAMNQVDRKYYSEHNPYMDAPQSIGYGATISAPHMHGTVLEALKDHLINGTRALDVGSGSGYLTVCMALMMGEKGRVIGIDHIKGLVDLSLANVKKDKVGHSLLQSQRIKLLVGDGRLGYPEEGPFDAIHVGAASPSLPHALMNQLKYGGRLIVPIGPEGGNQTLEQIDRKEDGTFTHRTLMGVMYVPLTEKDQQWPY